MMSANDSSVIAWMAEWRRTQEDRTKDSSHHAFPKAGLSPASERGSDVKRRLASLSPKAMSEASTRTPSATFSREGSIPSRSCTPSFDCIPFLYKKATSSVHSTSSSLCGSSRRSSGRSAKSLSHSFSSSRLETQDMEELCEWELALREEARSKSIFATRDRMIDAALLLLVLVLLLAKSLSQLAPSSAAVAASSAPRTLSAGGGAPIIPMSH